MDTYYRPSKKFSPFGMLAVFLTTAIAGAALSILYLFLVRICPMVYLNFLIAFVFGGFLGFIASRICKLFKIHNQLAVLIGMFLGIIVYTYIKWAFFVNYTFTGSYFNSFFDIVFFPGTVWDAIKIINQEGTWTLGSGVQNLGSHAVSGIMLWAVWIGEFILLTILNISLALSQVKTPFIDHENQWAIHEKDRNYVYFYKDLLSRKKEIEENYSILLELLEPRATINATDDFIRIYYYHSMDNTENYITIEECQYIARKKKLESKTVMEYLAVSEGFVVELFQRPSLSSESVYNNQSNDTQKADDDYFQGSSTGEVENLIDIK